MSPYVKHFTFLSNVSIKKTLSYNSFIIASKVSYLFLPRLFLIFIDFPTFNCVLILSLIVFLLSRVTTSIVPLVMIPPIQTGFLFVEAYLV